MHEAAHRIRFGCIIGNAGGFEDRGCGITASDPDTEYRLRAHPAAAMRLRDSRDGFCRSFRRSKGSRNIHDENGVVLRVLEQAPQRGGIAAGIGVAGDVDRVGA